MIDQLRHIEFPNVSRSSVGYPFPKACRVSECPGIPREGKEYCSDHIGEIPYVRVVQDRVALKEAEDSAILADLLDAKEIVQTETCKEIEMFIRMDMEGPTTTANLTKSLSIRLPGEEIPDDDTKFDVTRGRPLVDRCVTALWKMGKIRLAKAKRPLRTDPNNLVVMGLALKNSGEGEGNDQIF